MDANERDIAKQVFDLTDEQLDEFPQKQKEFLIKAACVLKEELKDNPEILEKVRKELFMAVVRFYADLKNI